MGCPVPIAFSKQPLDDLRVAWAQNRNVTGCLQAGDDFGFGIYSLSVPLVTDVIPVNKILLPLFWGVMTMRYVSSHSIVEVDSILGVKDISPPIFYFISIFSITFWRIEASLVLGIANCIWFVVGQLFWECIDTHRPHT
jgi:hypothetical protein